mmetsp:Transcript_39585/g.62611  ORF Transcript_39585/g.62611 Transcript_39585/m.62611 type:complete len:254 (+) Transcript_39585:87-848(+)
MIVTFEFSTSQSSRSVARISPTKCVLDTQIHFMLAGILVKSTVLHNGLSERLIIVMVSGSCVTSTHPSSLFFCAKNPIKPCGNFVRLTVPLNSFIPIKIHWRFSGRDSRLTVPENALVAILRLSMDSGSVVKSTVPSSAVILIVTSFIVRGRLAVSSVPFRSSFPQIDTRVIVGGSHCSEMDPLSDKLFQSRSMTSFLAASSTSTSSSVTWSRTMTFIHCVTSQGASFERQMTSLFSMPSITISIRVCCERES